VTDFKVFKQKVHIRFLIAPLKKAIDKQDEYKYYQSEWENLRFQSGDENEHLVLFVFPVLFEFLS